MIESILNVYNGRKNILSDLVLSLIIGCITLDMIFIVNKKILIHIRYTII